MLCKIAIVSILKPVDDVRLYHKLAQSLAKTNKYEVNIIGNRGKNHLHSQEICLHPHYTTTRNLSKRVSARLHAFRKTIQLAPKVFICTTHECLAIGILLKLLFGTYLIYDIQENYWANHLYIRSSLPAKLYGWLIRLKEYLAAPLYDHFLLAESCYRDELPFIQDRYTILENKAYHYDSKKKKEKQFIFSGTISEYSGTRQAVELFERVNPEGYCLLIIGQVHDKKLENYLYQRATNNKNIRLNISRDPISHTLIVEAISVSEWGFVAYQPNKVNRHKIPTKLYEYARYGVGVIVQQNTLWEQWCELYGFAHLEVAYGSSTSLNLKEVETVEFPLELTWEYEERRLLSAIDISYQP